MSKKSIGKQGHSGLLLLRIGIGILFVLHGYPKITGGPETWTKIGEATTYVGITFLPTFFGFMAAIAEFLGGILLIAGLYVRIAGVLMAITMIVAVAKHAVEGESFYHPLTNAIVFISLVLIGGGRYSLDRQFRKAK